MANELDLGALHRDRLLALASMFTAISSHGSIIGTAREIALIEFLRGLVPRRYEVLSGAIVEESEGKLRQASKQQDVLVASSTHSAIQL